MPPRPSKEIRQFIDELADDPELRSRVVNARNPAGVINRELRKRGCELTEGELGVLSVINWKLPQAKLRKGVVDPRPFFWYGRRRKLPKRP